MSLLDAWVLPTEAVIAVDTDGVARGGERDGVRMPVAKLLPIAHIPAAIAMRGSVAFLAGVAHCCLSRSLSSFDELVEALQPILELLSFPQELRDQDIELVAVGWSHRHSRMLGRLFTKRGDEPFSARDTEGCIAPWDAASMSDIPTTADALERIAQAQVRWMQEHEGIGGGRLVVCRIDQRSMSVNHVLQFEEEEATCRQ